MKWNDGLGGITKLKWIKLRLRLRLRGWKDSSREGRAHVVCLACLQKVSSLKERQGNHIVDYQSPSERVDDPTHQHTDLSSSQLCGSRRITRVSFRMESSQWTHDRHASESKRVIEPVSIRSISLVLFAIGFATTTDKIRIGKNQTEKETTHSTRHTLNQKKKIDKNKKWKKEREKVMYS